MFLTTLRARAVAVSAACLLGAATIPAVADTASPAPAAASVVFSTGPGTGAPPATLGSYTMKRFGADSRTTGSAVTGVSGPTGTLGFSPALTHARVGQGWATWSHGYTGDVYWTSATATTLTLPPRTGAFYLYAEPEQFATFSITATTGEGTTSGAVSVEGKAGARYFGFYSTGPTPITKITVSTSDPTGLAVGEFGIAEAGFQVKGSLPVRTARQGNESQYTSTYHPGITNATCNHARMVAAMLVGRSTVAFFQNAGAYRSAALLGHFMGGSGKPVNYSSTSVLAKATLADPEFKKLNQSVKDELKKQLDKGATSVTLGAPPMSRVVLKSTLDLWGAFRGTQGLKITGSGKLSGGKYVGTLTYVIQDSYGFTSRDTFYGFGSSMRYLQINCGAPQHRGGAHWFADSVTVSVPFSLPANPAVTRG
ncbi:hypothetical protein [Streptomyces sp.]|uniref:hypothetical protein n=1 Tax=Streptomyces sp. TaxID=1931 RepID=UPI002F406CDC